MKYFKLDKVFVIASIIAAIFAIILLNILQQEEYMNNAIDALNNHNQQEFETNVSKLDNIDYVYKNSTLLMRACESGNGQAIEYLILHGADVNYTTNGSLTPLEIFCARGYVAGTSALNTMLNSGARQSVYSQKPAIFLLADQYAWMNEQQKELATDLTIILLQRGAPIGFGDTSLLHVAAKNDMSDLFYQLVHTKQGLALINMKDANGQTPYAIAVSSGSINVQRTIRNLEEEYKEYQTEIGQGKDDYDDVLSPMPQG